MFFSLFQTASGSWHISSILMASGWLLSFVVTGIFIFANLNVNRNERILAHQKEQQSENKLKETRSTLEEKIQISIAELDKTKSELEKIKPRSLTERMCNILNTIDLKIIPSLKSGTTIFEGGITSSQFNNLQAIAKENGAEKYITISPDVRMGVGMGPEGVTYGVKFTLNPQLTKD